VTSTTCIRRAAWLVAWDETAACHRYLRDADLAFRDDRIDYVGPRYRGHCDEEIDGAGRLVLPGLVNIHCHPTSQPITRGVREEMGNPRFYSSALYDRTNLWAVDDQGLIDGARVALAELLASGVTTVLDYAQRIPPGWLELLADSGIRAFAAPSFRDAAWVVRGASRLGYEWDESAGRAERERAFELIEAADCHPSGRLSGVVAPAQVDTCTEQTLRESHRVARSRGCMWQVHAAQSLTEFHEMTQRHGCTPVQWLHAIGVLDERSTVGHGIFVDEHPWTHWASREDLHLLATSGASVAHCPLVFSRYGQAMHSLGGYLRAGINIGIGCDTAPHNMLEEMRSALIVSRLASGHMHDVDAAQVFHAATVGGARALGRDDLGRLAPGAKADVVLVDLEHRYMRPARDPLRNLIYTAADRAVRDVYVGGRQVLAGGEIRTLDLAQALAGLEAAQARAEAGVPSREPHGRTALDVSPLTLPLA